MPAGSYYVGDLCYVMNDEDWREICKLTIGGNECIEGEFTLSDGRRFAMYDTAYGDGGYLDQTGNEYSVDSGTIGCIKVSDITKFEYEHIEELGVMHEFDKPFETSGGRGSLGRDWDGVIKIGRIHIETDPVYEEEE